MSDTTWQQTHLARVQQRLSGVQRQPDGTVYETTSPLHTIRVVKHAGQIHFYFVDPASGTLHGPMSRMEMAQPLHLLAEYTQAAMLTLLWRPQPARVCMLGLAGGRLSLLFYHTFPQAVIDNVDVDPAVGTVAEQFFGVTFDARNTLAVADGRAFLQAGGSPYDIIIMDAFRDDSDNLNHLATREFYALCTVRLARGGVLCANILKADPRFWEKINTFFVSFQHAFVAEQKHGVVVFGNNTARFTQADLLRRAAEVQHAHGFSFPFEERAAALRPARAITAYSRAALRGIAVLSDREG